MSEAKFQALRVGCNIEGKVYNANMIYLDGTSATIATIHGVPMNLPLSEIRPSSALRTAFLMAAAPDLFEALQDVPLPSNNGGRDDFIGRFYRWYNGTRKAALAKAKPLPPEAME